MKVGHHLAWGSCSGLLVRAAQTMGQMEMTAEWVAAYPSVRNDEMLLSEQQLRT